MQKLIKITYRIANIAVGLAFLGFVFVTYVFLTPEDKEILTLQIIVPIVLISILLWIGNEIVRKIKQV